MAPQVRKAIERFMDKVTKTESCWTWLGGVSRNYGMFRHGSGHNGAQGKAHRFSYEYFVGPIPSGYQIDHLCNNTLCVNPSHLRAVTPRDNVMRSNNPAALNAKRDRCIRGHALTGDNLYVEPNTQKRQCRTCKSDRGHARYLRLKRHRQTMMT